MREIVATVPQYTILPEGSVYQGEGRFQMRGEGPAIKELIMEKIDGVTVFRKEGFVLKPIRERGGGGGAKTEIEIGGRP